MAFPDGWGRRCELKIQNSKVPANLTNFPVYFTNDNLPAEMMTAGGEYCALNGGGDIRFSSDVDGVNRLACEIVEFAPNFIPANADVEIWVNVPSVSSSVDTSIWVWYVKTGESQPARDAAYGMEATWNSDFVGVWHLNEASGAAKDSTSYNTDGVVSGGITREAVGKIGKAYQNDGADGQINAGDPVDGHLDFGTGSFTKSVWLNIDSMPSWAASISKGTPSSPTAGYRFEHRPDPSNTIYSQISDGSTYVTTDPQLDVTLDTWIQWVARLDRTPDELRMFEDGVDSASVSTSGIGDINSTADLLLLKGTNALLGWADEFRLSKIARPNGWIVASYNSQDDPATFVIEQTPESPTAYKLEGITYDKNGDALVSCKCFLFKDNQNNTLTYVDYVLSDGATGAYSFTGIGDDDAQYIVIAWKDNTPHVFDASDHVLQPVEE